MTFSNFVSVPDNGPATITLVAVSDAVVNVTWTPVPVEIRNGLILGYNVGIYGRLNVIVLLRYLIIYNFCHLCAATF